MITVRTGCRVDLAGGTLDIWPLGQLHPGARTINVAVDVPVTVRLQASPSGYWVRQGDSEVRASSPAGLLKDPLTALPGLLLEALEVPPVELTLESGSPRGGGLGGSSALAVALVRAAERFLGRSAAAPVDVAALVRDIEARLMGLPTGNQDQFPPLLGGVLEVRYQPGGTRVRRLDGTGALDLADLAGAFTLAYSGKSHISAEQNWQVVRRRLEGDPEVIELLEGISRAAGKVAAALTAGDLETAGRAVGEEWSLRRRLAPGVSTPELEALLEAALQAGAWGGKACGAGGGGCVVALGPASRQQEIATAVSAAGGKLLAARPVAEPLRIEEASG